jgi:hypothetical protein
MHKRNGDTQHVQKLVWKFLVTVGIVFPFHMIVHKAVNGPPFFQQQLLRHTHQISCMGIQANGPVGVGTGQGGRHRPVGHGHGIDLVGQGLGGFGRWQGLRCEGGRHTIGTGFIRAQQRHIGAGTNPPGPNAYSGSGNASDTRTHHNPTGLTTAMRMEQGNIGPYTNAP